MKKLSENILLIVLCSAALNSCLRLDDQFFPNVKIENYQLDNYTGERELSDMPASYGVTSDKTNIIKLVSDDDGDVQDIYAIYLGDIDSIFNDTVILYCHGNRDHMDFYWNRAKLLSHVNGTHTYGVLMMDYRGYGMSTGVTTESGMYADVNACMQWLEDHGLTNNRLIIYGYSLGSAPATELCAHPGTMLPSRIILEAPFSSAETMIQDAALAALPSSYFTDIEVDNGEEIKSVHQPLCWLHGTDDDFLKIETHGEVVFANHPGPEKIAYRVSQGLHNDVPSKMGYANYLNALGDFIRHE